MKVSEGDKLAGAEAAGYYFGISNLALDQPMIRGYKKYSEFVTKHAPDWKRIKSVLSQQLNLYMESDEMLDQAMDEINDWIKQAKEGDSYVVGEWKKIVAGQAE